MATRSKATQEKRRKEMARKEKQRMKAERRLQRKQNPGEGEGGPPIDYGTPEEIVAGEDQPPREGL